MKRILLIGVALALVLSTAASVSAAMAQEPIKLVVWDWKSGEPASVPYFEKAKEAFEKLHPNVTIEHVAQPHEEYYTIVGTAAASQSGPDLIMFHGGGWMLDRKDMVIPINDYIKDIKDQLVGWDDFTDSDGNVYCVPLTAQGVVIYYNKNVYKEAGLDPENPPTTWDAMVQTCDTIKEKTGKTCFTYGEKEGWNSNWWVGLMIHGQMTRDEMQQFIDGTMKFTDPKPLKTLQLFQEAINHGWFPEGAASLLMFPDSFEIFERGDAAHAMGLISDAAHWKEFGDFLGDANVGVIKGLVIDTKSVPDYDALTIGVQGGIGYGVAKWSPNKEMAVEYAKFLANKDNLQNFFLYAGAIVPRKDFDPALMPSRSGKTILEWLACCTSREVGGLMSTEAQAELGRQTQLMLTGQVTPEQAAEAIQKAAEKK
jgi:raffinose/stachyose/melibiose transport system substrate-binding protein